MHTLLPGWLTSGVGMSHQIRSSVLLVLPALWAQENAVRSGAEVYADTCASGYCHGTQGAASGAPKLSGRSFTLAYIREVVTSGKSEMPAFGGKLAARDLDAVISYVASMNGISPESVIPATDSSRHVLSPGATQGRALFFEAIRAFGRCSTCHRLDGNGIAIADPISHIPGNVPELRTLQTRKVHTVQFGSESFPAVVVKENGDETMVYDLTSSPPVRRTVSSAKIQIVETSEWRHSSVIQSYSSEELEYILLFLREIAKP